jgi:hypothetical protein
MNGRDSNAAAPALTSTTAAPAERLDRGATNAALRAASYARATYPGPIGELIDRELRGYVGAGQVLPATALASRLIVQLTTAQARDAQSSATPSRLPARYRPGTPLHWDYAAP